MAAACVAVSTLPLQSWAQELLGEDVQVLVGPGQSPALFEPTARQLSALSAADLFFAIGVPFERAWLPRITADRPDLEIVDLAAGLPRRCQGFSTSSAPPGTASQPRRSSRRHNQPWARCPPVRM